MKEHKDDFLGQLRHTLLHHEEPYKEGAWEQFLSKSKTENKKTVIPLVWKWIAVAAAIAGILFLSQYFYTPSKNNSTQPIVITQNQKNIDSIKENSDAPADTIQQEITTYLPNNILPPNVPNIAPVSPIAANSGITKIAKKEKENVMVPEMIIPPKNQEEKKDNVAHFWENEIVPNDNTAQNTMKKDKVEMKRAPVPGYATTQPNNGQKRNNKKWRSSLYVSPIFGTTGVNMGGGYSFGLAVSKRLTINTGVAYARVSASKYYDVPVQSGMNASVITNNSLSVARNSSNLVSAPSMESVEGYMSGIDVPLEISYNFSKKLYASGGVSGLFVLNDKKQYNYVISNNERITVYSSDGKVKEDKNVLINQYSSTDAPISNSTSDKSNFLGFYNFSLGYKQKITAKNNVSIEPFVKVPVKTVSNSHLNYIGMGVRLKFDF
jgi:hypothetical protein